MEEGDLRVSFLVVELTGTSMGSNIVKPTNTRWEPRRLSNMTNELSTLLELSSSSNHTFESCGNDAPGMFYLNVQGPEDPRVFWSSLGEPLLLYNSHSVKYQSKHCRVMHIVDLRSVCRMLRTQLDDIGYNAPMRFPESTAIEGEDQYYIEKNWALLTDYGNPDQIYFHRTLIPRHISKWNALAPGDKLENVLLESRSSIHNNCLEQLLPLENQPQNVKVSIHQTTIPITITLCNRGQCTPDIHNTVHLVIGHWSHKTEPRFYERYNI
jgi:hypothetical protein